MGTDVNTIAWENAEIVARIICDLNKYNTLADAFLYFGSQTSSESGKFSVQTGDPTTYVMGDNSYSLSGQQVNIPDLTRILYETFYKHNF